MASSLRLKARFQFVTLCYGAAIFMVFGFIALTVASNMSNVLNGNTNLYIRVWGESMMMVVMGLALISAAFLVSSSKVDRIAVGGIIGVGFSVVGTVVAIDLLDVLLGYQEYMTTNAGSFFEGMLIVCFVAVVLVGFPMGMVGSLGGIWNSQAVPESATSEGTAAC